MVAKPRRNVLRKAADAGVHPAEPRTPAVAKARRSATGAASGGVRAARSAGGQAPKD